MAGQAETMMGREGEARWSPPRPHSGSSEGQMRKIGECFNCKKRGHWAKECPEKTKTPGRSPPSDDRDVRPWVCRCSEGTCVVVTISGVKQYCCPGRKGDGSKCGFQMPCGLAVFDENLTPRPPICTCEAGLSRICTMNEGPNAGRPYYGCSIKKGQGACSFFQWCDEYKKDDNQYDEYKKDDNQCGGASQSINVRNDEGGNAIPLVDDLEELGEEEMQIFHDACKRKCDEVNQAGCSSEQKKMKMAMPVGIYPPIESDQLTSPGNVAHITDLNQVTAPNASTGSAEVSSPAMDTCLNDAAESNLKVSPKGCTRHSTDPDGKSKGSQPISKVDFAVNGARHIFSNTQRRLQFDEDICIDSVSDKILAIIGNCIRYGSGSSEVTHSPIVAAHSIILLSQSSTATGDAEKLFPEENKASCPLFSSNDSSLLCVLGLLKSTPLKDLPSLEEGIRRLISDLDTTSKDAKILNRVLECLLFLGDAYRAKEMTPSFTPAEEEFQHSQAFMKDEILKLTNECSKTTVSLREASLHVEQCRASRQRAQLDVTALETELGNARMAAAEMMAREEEAQERVNELKEDNYEMARQLGELVMRRASEDYEHQEHIAAFDAADKKRARELAILEEAAEVVVRMLEGEL